MPGPALCRWASVPGSGALYPFRVMQADHALVARRKSGSWMTSVLMSSFIVSMPASEAANCAFVEVRDDVEHRPAAAGAGDMVVGRSGLIEEAAGGGPGEAVPGGQRGT